MVPSPHVSDHAAWLVVPVDYEFLALYIKTWAVLYRACAYGVEPLAERLVKEGADVNSRNCFGYTALIEACHRGFVNIVSYLLKGKGGVDLAYIPSDTDSMASPFVSSPPHGALGEAARSGYPRIVQVTDW